MKKTLLGITCFFAYSLSIPAQTLYGTTLQGGGEGGGTINKFMTHRNNLTVAKSFESFDNPSGSLIQSSDGKLYGMTTNGGSTYAGAIFSFDPFTSIYTTVKDFDYTNGANPYGSLMQATDAKLYGMTTYGGSSGYGVIFSFDPSSSNYTKLMDFDNTNGAYPLGSSLMQASDGKLYGMTYNGGSSNAGVIFSFDPSTSSYTKLMDFDNYANGGYPLGTLIQAHDGILYGMTAFGGSSGVGVIFSYDPFSFTQAKLIDFDNTNGASPFGSLMQASDGKLYGMTQYGGTSYNGVIFSFDLSSFIYTKLKDYDGANGANPYGNLMQASDGKLYGTTYQGGSGDGVIFSFDLSSSTYTKLINYNGANGATPSLGSTFIELQKPTKPLLGINDATVYEMAGSVALTVTLPKKTAHAVSVNYKTVDGTARSKANPADYIAKTGVLVIPAGSQTATISIMIIADDVLEPPEKFYVELGKPGNSIAKATASITILDGTQLNSTIVSRGNKQQQIFNEKQRAATEFILKASPNPSSSQFTLKIESGATNKILNLRVADVLGRLIEVKNNIFAGETLQLGNNYRPGVYIVEVTQGNNKKQLKLIKLAD